MTAADASNDTRVRRIEQRALLLSASAYGVSGVAGIICAVLAKSDAILFDAVFSLISLALVMLGKKVAQLAEEPGNHMFHFGFAQFEPLVNLVRGLVILSLSAYAVASSVYDIFHGGREMHFGIAMGYAFITTALSVFLAGIQRRNAKIVNSPVLNLDAKNWILDGGISFGVGMAFLIAYLMQGTELNDLVPYVDPTLLIIIVLGLIGQPLATVVESAKAVMQAAPDDELQNKIRAAVERGLEGEEREDLLLRMMPLGRFLYVMVHLRVKPAPSKDGVAHWDEVRSRVAAELRPVRERIVFDVIVVSKRWWMNDVEEEPQDEWVPRRKL